MSDNPTEIAVGDDLSDGLDYVVDFSSGEEDGEQNSPQFSDDSIARSLQETPSTETYKESPIPKKRKIKSSKLHEKKRLKMEIDMEQKKNLAIEESTEAIIDYINAKIREKNPSLSSLELSQLYVDKSDVRSTGSFTKARNLENLSGFLEEKFENMLPSLKSKKQNNKNASKEPQRKFIAIISSSAIRACDLHRATRDLKGSSLKLINKNKLSQDLKILGTTRSRILCCTPSRLIKVLKSENSSIKKEEIKIVILNSSYLDQKAQNVFDSRETLDLIKELKGENGSKLYLY